MKVVLQVGGAIMPGTSIAGRDAQGAYNWMLPPTG